MPKPGEIRYCPELGGQATNAAFVWIPPGSFWMGDKQIKGNPVRFVAITKGYWLQQTPLTERQYNGKDSDRPRVDISWDDVFHFCHTKPLRIPTEAEWEYAARSNTGHKYLWSGSNVVNNAAWTKKNSERRSHNVGQLKSNNLGLFDMSGNAWDWCSDWGEGLASSAPQVNPIGAVTGVERGTRGGSWAFEIERARVADRVHSIPSNASFYLGARLIWEAQDA